MQQVDLIVTGASQLVTCAASQPKRGPDLRDVGIIPDGALAIHEGRIVAVGSSAEIRHQYGAAQIVDAGGKAVCPGFVDCHTHTVYAGDRIAEFERRIAGVSYMQILAEGGGILHTMRATRDAAAQQLVAEARTRLNTMLRLGTTTVEIKTGYGLELASELAMLDAIAELDRTHPVDTIPTFLGAHAVPPEFTGYTDDYAQHVIEVMLPAAYHWYRDSHFAAQGLPLYVDVFCEAGVFSAEQSRRILSAGKSLGMGVKAHVDEFVTQGGVGVALALEATSVDHLDVTPPDDIAALAQSGTVAVVMPAVNFHLGSTHFAAARALIDAGAIFALATDLNPGSAPCPSLPLVMAIACRYQRVLPAEALNAVTINAAHALGLGREIGSLEVGKQADILILNTEDYRALMAQFGDNAVTAVIKRGQLVHKPAIP